MFDLKENKELFNEQAQEWWDSKGVFKTLHQVNPLRIQFMLEYVDFFAKKVLDVGCGGGILSEAVAKLDAKVTAIDTSHQSIQIAKKHCPKHIQIDYQNIALENIEQKFDVVTCMEMIEHVKQPQEIIQQIAQKTKTQGYVFLSTINKNISSFLLVKLMAEYVLDMIPKGTHDFNKFIKPSDLCQMAYECQLNPIAIKGIGYNPLSDHFHLTQSVKMNYIIVFQKI